MKVLGKYDEDEKEQEIIQVKGIIKHKTNIYKKRKKRKWEGTK